MFLGYSSCWEKPQKQAVGQVTLGAQGHCPPAVRQTLRDGTFHWRRLNLAVGRFLPLPPQKNTPAVPGDSSLLPSCHGAAAVTSVYDTLLPLSPHLPPSLADQMPGRRWELARERRFPPGPAVCSPETKREQEGGQGCKRAPPEDPPAPFLVDALFWGFFPPIFLPPCGVHSSQRSRTRNVVIGWAAGPTSGNRTEPLQGWQDTVGAASFLP